MNGKVAVIGGKPLRGEVIIRGAKNAVPKEMVAALLTSEPCTLNNIARVEDIGIVGNIIKLAGGLFEDRGDEVVIEAKELKVPQSDAITEFAGKSRIPTLFCGPYLSRTGEAVVPAPGGCDIGPRPINFHLQALEQMGATVEARGDYYYLHTKGLTGAKIRLDYPSVGATEQVLLASVLADGVTELSNAAVEPEIIDLISVLQKMGAIISVDTDRVITVTGVKKLGGFNHTPIPDRLEAASWACAAAVTNGKITVKNARQLDLMTFLNKYRQIGGGFDITDSGITFYRQKTDLNSISLETDVHPGFMTDRQQPFVVVLTQAAGTSIIHETVYENRFGYIETLNKMGAQIQLYKQCLGGRDCRFAGSNYLHSAAITGPTELTGADIKVPDLRGGFSYVIAALAAQGKSTIENFNVLSRGYENFVEKLQALGAQIEEI